MNNTLPTHIHYKSAPRTIGAIFRAMLPYLTATLTIALAFSPSAALAGNCSSFSNDASSGNAMPYYVNLLLNNLPYVLAVLAIAFIAFAALDQGQLPALAKNGLYVLAVVCVIGAILTFLTGWHPTCFS